MERLDKGQDIVLVASEPLTFERSDWVTVPTNCFPLTVESDHSGINNKRTNCPSASYRRFKASKLRVDVR